MKKLLLFALAATGAIIVACFALALVVPSTKTNAPKLAVTIYAAQPTARPTPAPSATPAPTPTEQPVVVSVVAPDGEPLTESQYGARVAEIAPRLKAQLEAFGELDDNLGTVEGRNRLLVIGVAMRLIASDFRAMNPPPRFVPAHAHVLAIADDLDNVAQAISDERYVDAVAHVRQITTDSENAAKALSELE